MHKKSYKARRAGCVPENSSSSNPLRPSLTDAPAARELRRAIEVEFLELGDGRLVEMIEHPADPTKALLATWSNGQVFFVEKLEFGDKVLLPLARDADIIRHIMLANGCESYGSTRQLLAGIILVLGNTLELPWEQLLLLSTFVLSTWFIEKLPIAPYVALVGPPSSGKTTALRVLSLLCRRGLLTADISSAAFYEVCNRITTTLLIDETATVGNRRDLFHLLRTGTTQGFVAIRKNRSFKSYGARVVSYTELPDDAALNSRCLIIPMVISKLSDVLAPTDARVLQAAESLRRQLLQFRLSNYRTLTLSKIPGEEELQPRTRDLLRALAFPLGEERVICEELLLYLKNQQSLRSVLSVEGSAVLDFLYHNIHSSPGLDRLLVKELTKGANEILRLAGEWRKLSEKRAGYLLTSLDLRERTKQNNGYVLWFTRKTRERIHSLAQTYGVNVSLTPAMAVGCDLCQKESAPATSGSRTDPFQGETAAEENRSREHGEHRERGESTIKRKTGRAARRAG
jgi:hypothetical protein